MIHFTTELECIYALVRAAVGDMDYGMVHISSHAGTYHPCGYAERGECCNDHNGRKPAVVFLSCKTNHHHNSRISS